MDHVLLQNGVEHPVPGEEHKEDSSMKVEVAFDGVQSPFRFRHKKRSKVWEEYKPIFLNGKVQFAECLYCHNRLSCKDSNGTSHLWRHQKICPGKEEAAQRRQKDSYFPCGRHGRGQIHQKGLFYPSSIPSLKSKMQDELSPALTNGKVQIAEYSSKLLRTSSSGDSTPKPIRVVPAQHSLPTPDCTSLKKQRTSFVTTPIGQETSDPELAGMIAMHGYPLSIVEHEEMVRFVNKLNPVVNLVSRNGLEEHCLALFQKEKENLKSKIAHSSRRVSLSASIWTPDGSEPTVNYLCLTAHYVDEDWKVHRIIIKFGMFWSVPADLERMVHCMEACVPESESGSYNIISDAIRDWNLDQKLLSLISVGEVRDDNNTSLLKEMLIEKKFLPIGGKLYNVSCVDYILNSIVFKVQSDILHLVSDIVMEFLVSLTQQQLLEVISHMGLKCPQEDAKWWHKLYFRLEVLLHFKKSFPSDERLSPEDTKIVESVCKILRTFYRVIEVISSPSSPTANMYFNEIWKIRTVLQEEALNDHRDIATMVMMMQEAFNEYWQNSYLWLAIPVVLDPRFKFSFIEFRLKRAFGTDSASYLSVIRETVRELFNEYCNSLNQTIAVVSNSEAFGADDGDSLEDWDRHLHEQASSQLSSELDDYLEDGLVPRKDDFDILNWWMTHTTKYPTLATIARDILAMPASAVQSEAAFSSSGPVIPKHQSALNIRTIEALVCTRDWMR
ncbi:zinc finger BED domain-containing protein RICESLEEPER 1-like isoform X2 [Oryza brachyantha]|uniref:zinc finger BED domain-containing protein RICESLEEPER 1-like isoform X2 n=1 Tax=Oryza brachyantha TaxID=4533 RepID=UPI0007760EFD|nr:zinc finger BED domain-containing protein RICESLEEPER 1-like isoform X2 [Oryza brachyantha]